MLKIKVTLVMNYFVIVIILEVGQFYMNLYEPKSLSLIDSRLEAQF